LPVFENPPLKGLDDYTHILSIILNNKKAYAWLSENYVQLLALSGLDNNIMLFNFIDYSILSNTEYYFAAKNKTCPFLDIYREPYTEYQSRNMSIIDYLKFKIINDFYIFLYVDTSKIPAYNRVLPAEHCPLIFGFDDEKEIFYFRDYCGMYYETHTAAYSEMEQAITGFMSSPDIRASAEYELLYSFGINFIRLVDCDYMFNIDRLKLLLRDYLAGDKMKDTYFRIIDNEDFSYGISVFDMTISDLEECINQDSNYIGRIIRYIQFIDHKVAMQIRLEYLKNIGFIKQDDFERLYNAFENAIKIARTIQNMYLKYKKTNDKKIINKMIDALKQLKEIDVIYIKDLLTLLAPYRSP